MTDDLLDAWLAAPLGVSVLAAFEQQGLGRRIDPSAPSDPNRVAAAVETAGSCTFAELLGIVVDTLCWSVGPWSAGAVEAVTAAYRDAPGRRAIAEVLVERFGGALHAPVDLDAQEWWTHEDWDFAKRLAPLFDRYEDVYAPGQFTWAGLRTHTTVPPALHEAVVDAGERHDRGLARWRLPVAADARVVEIHRPGDWAALVRAHPAEGTGNEGWELPGRNQDLRGVAGLAAIAGQHACHTEPCRHLVPDWRAVAAHHDGIHLSWAGVITAEGFVSDLGGGDVAMLRYWFSEETLWLHDVFGEPEPLPGPRVDGGVDVSAPGADARRVADRHTMRLLLGRA